MFIDLKSSNFDVLHFDFGGELVIIGDLKNSKWPMAAILDFSVNGALRIPLELVSKDRIKAYGLRNKSAKFHNSTKICSGMFHTLISTS